MEPRKSFDIQSKIEDADLQIAKKISMQAYNTEIPVSKKAHLKWPLKKLSEGFQQTFQNKKFECKTSIDLLSNKVSIRESSQQLICKSEYFLEKAVKSSDADSDIDSCSSDDSIEDPNISPNSKPRFDECVNKYYMASSDNLPGNYDLYVTNCLKFISYFKGIN